MRTSKPFRWIVLVLALVGLACGSISEALFPEGSEQASARPTATEWLAPSEQAGEESEATPSPEEPEEPSEQVAPTRLPVNARPVYVLGRSVTYGWFEHWGWPGDDETPVVHGRYVLYHRNIEPPEDMVTSVREIVRDVPDTPNPTIHWKFCFDDFSGGDEAQFALSRDEQIVQQVYQIVVGQHKHPLIIGNALPKVAQDVDADLVNAQRQYNQWLAQFAGSHPNEVFIFDQYAVLADANGSLRANFATARDDSHPNEAGYRAMDAPYFSLLDRMVK